MIRAFDSKPARSEPFGDDQARELASLGQALSDPIRVKMLGMMAAGRECCSIPDCGVSERDKDAGICICEFERTFELSQSKVSYHMKKLKEARLILEERRGRWNFYSLNSETVAGMISELQTLHPGT